MLYEADHSRNILEGFLNFFFPLTCVSCGQYISESSGYSLCERCCSQIEFLNGPVCVSCGRSLPHFRLTKCRRCREKPFSFDAARAVTVYISPIRESIHALKYKGMTSFAPFFGHLLLEYLKTNPFLLDVDGILPVPLHPFRLQERGFNQSEIMARSVSRSFHLPLIRKKIFRTKLTRSQIGLSARDRRLNLQNAFSIPDPGYFRAKKILIIDDVMTSRATGESLSRALRNSGCERIYLLVLASGKSLRDE
ncbi:MAG: ComF family protein [Candidatus Atribacteria bacterium]|nr:ComF family protein [Candidatus Atribacteria bacterium]